MAKKRPTLDAFLNLQSESGGSGGSDDDQQAPRTEQRKRPTAATKTAQPAKKTVPKSVSKPEAWEPAATTASASPVEKHEIVRHMLYIPLPVYDQLQGLIFEEQRGQAKRRKTHDYLLDAVDLLFKKKGLKSIAELTGKKTE